MGMSCVHQAGGLCSNNWPVFFTSLSVFSCLWNVVIFFPFDIYYFLICLAKILFFFFFPVMTASCHSWKLCCLWPDRDDRLLAGRGTQFTSLRSLYPCGGVSCGTSVWQVTTPIFLLYSRGSASHDLSLKHLAWCRWGRRLAVGLCLLSKQLFSSLEEKKVWSVWKCPLHFPMNHTEHDNAKHAFCSGIWLVIDW